jgi:hypothetical protein
MAPGLAACGSDQDADPPDSPQGNSRDAGEQENTDDGADTGDANDQESAPRGGTDTADNTGDGAGRGVGDD